MHRLSFRYSVMGWCECVYIGKINLAVLTGSPLSPTHNQLDIWVKFKSNVSNLPPSLSGPWESEPLCMFRVYSSMMLCLRPLLAPRRPSSVWEHSGLYPLPILHLFIIYLPASFPLWATYSQLTMIWRYGMKKCQKKHWLCDYFLSYPLCGNPYALPCSV